MRPRRRRGSVLVEAVAVISVFVLFFGGIVYFGKLYVEHLTVARLARATAMAHAVGACKGDPAARLGAGAGTRRMDGKTASGIDFGTVPGGADKGSAALERLRSDRGDRALPTTTITLQGDPGSSTSFVACTDEVTDDQYGALADTITSLFDQ